MIAPLWRAVALNLRSVQDPLRLDWLAPCVQVTIRIVCCNAFPPLHILRRCSIQAHIEVPNHGAERNIKFAPSQIVAKACSGSSTEWHQPVIQLLVTTIQPALWLEGQRVSK